MTTAAYLTLKGKNQGPIPGSVTLPGHEGTILIHSYTMETDSPRDPVSGLPTGKLVHSPIILLKDLDASSPLLWTAFLTNENLVSWSLAFFTTAPDANGVATEKQTYTVRLTNASISSIREFKLDDRDPTTPGSPVQQQLSFTYQAIEWILTDGEVTAQDSWQ